MSQIFLLTHILCQYILMSCRYSNFIGLLTNHRQRVENIIQSGQALCAANVMVEPPTTTIAILGER